MLQSCVVLAILRASEREKCEGCLPGSGPLDEVCATRAGLAYSP